VQLLGTPQILVNDQPIQVDTRKAIALIAYLATGELIQRRSVLAAFLWPESDDSRARSALRRTLAALNKAIDGPWLEADRETIELVPQSSLMVDVLEVRRLLKAIRAAGSDCAQTVPLLEEAIGHFRGAFMQGFTLYDSPECDRIIVMGARDDTLSTFAAELVERLKS
jgi:DNA-binding SARP family transcriptional activator